MKSEGAGTNGWISTLPIASALITGFTSVAPLSSSVSAVPALSFADNGNNQIAMGTNSGTRVLIMRYVAFCKAS